MVKAEPPETPAKTLFGPKSVSSLVEAKPVASAVGDEPVPAASPPELKLSHLSIDASLIDAFEKELKLFEDKSSVISKPVPKFKTPAVPAATDALSLECCKNELLQLRDEVRRLDSDVRQLYTRNASQVPTADMSRLEAKFNIINDGIEEISQKIQIPTTRRSSPSAPSVIFDNVCIIPRSTPATPSMAIFRPLPPSLRREPPAGLSSMTPIKVTPKKHLDRGYGHIFSDAAPSVVRRDSFTPKPMKNGKRMSLGDLITGKILASPEGRSRPTSPDISVPVIAPGGHGVAWQLLRQIEAQHRELESLLRKVSLIERK